MVTEHTCKSCGYQKTHCQCNPFVNDDLTELELNQRKLRDQYTKENSQFDESEYVRKLVQGSTLRYSISDGEQLSKYIERLRVHVEMQAEKNVKKHIHNMGRGCWFTHKDKMGEGCFMCEDLNLYHYLFTLIEYLSAKYPNTTIKST